MKQLILIISTFLSIRTISAQNFSGTIVNKRTNEKLQGAVVSIKTNDKKINRSVISDSTGRFIFNDIPLGSFELKVSLLEFKPYKAVISSNATNVTIQLEQDFAELLEVRVFSKLNGEKEVSSRIQEKNANNIINIISAQAIQKSPDINAANILQRVSGVTIQRNSGATDAYSIIRGLEPRYNNTLINNIKIPSSDDKSRFVSLDIIPSDLLQKIEVSKSLLPEMEGDAIGGTVNLVMKDAPDTMSFKMFGSVGYSTLFFKNKYSSFSKKNIQSKSLYERYGANYVAQPGDFSRSNLDFKNTTALPTVYAGFSYGKRFFNNKLGLLIAENFQNQYYGTVSVFNQVTPDVNLGIPTYSDYSNRYFSTQQLNNGITTHLDYNINDKNKLILNSVFIYNSDYIDK